MSDHLDAPGPTGISDFYVFRKPEDPSKTILILDVDPMASTPTDAFEPEASYELQIDTNGDAQADMAYHIRFAPSRNGSQTATVYRLAGAMAREMGAKGDAVIRAAPVSDGSQAHVTTEGRYRFYAGLRSDPFFADLLGFQNNLQFTGDDFFADKNVLGIVLEVPNSDLGSNSHIGLWARTVAPVHGTVSTVDQFGRPLINILFNPAEDAAHRFNVSDPAQQRETFLPHFVTVLQGFGYSEEEAGQLAGNLLPDIMPYDYASSAGYPNGRTLTDDVTDAGLPLLTHGKITTDLVGPHTDFLGDFPYLGAPH